MPLFIANRHQYQHLVVDGGVDHHPGSPSQLSVGRDVHEHGVLVGHQSVHDLRAELKDLSVPMIVKTNVWFPSVSEFPSISAKDDTKKRETTDSTRGVKIRFGGESGRWGRPGNLVLSRLMLDKGQFTRWEHRLQGRT